MAELLARAGAARWRERAGAGGDPLRSVAGPFRLHAFLQGWQRAGLGNREFQMMEMLMEAPRCIISTAQFMERVWGWDAEVM